MKSATRKTNFILMQRVNYLIRSADDDGAWYLLSSPTNGQNKFFSQYQNSVKAVTNEITILKQSQLNPEGINAIREFENQWGKYLQANDDVFAIFKRGEIQKAQSAYPKFPLNHIESLVSYQNKLHIERLKIWRIRSQPSSRSSPPNLISALFLLTLSWAFSSL